MKIRPCAAIVADNKLLTLRYNYNNTAVYAIPGGNLELGEKLEKALVRELIEEIGLQIEVGELLLVAEVHQADKDTLHFVFESKIISGEAFLNPQETSALEICWISLSNINDINLYPNVKTSLYKYFVEGEKQSIFLGEIAQTWH